MSSLIVYLLTEKNNLLCNVFYNGESEIKIKNWAVPLSQQTGFATSGRSDGPSCYLVKSYTLIKRMLGTLRSQLARYKVPIFVIMAGQI